MKKEKLTKFSPEELNKKHKTLKFVLIFLIVFIAAFVFYFVFFTEGLDTTFYVIFPVIFMPGLLVNLLLLKKFKTEIDSRK